MVGARGRKIEEAFENHKLAVAKADLFIGAIKRPAYAAMTAAAIYAGISVYGAYNILNEANSNPSIVHLVELEKTQGVEAKNEYVRENYDEIYGPIRNQIVSDLEVPSKGLVGSIGLFVASFAGYFLVRGNMNRKVKIAEYQLEKIVNED